MKKRICIALKMWASLMIVLMVPVALGFLTNFLINDVAGMIVGTSTFLLAASLLLTLTADRQDFK